MLLVINLWFDLSFWSWTKRWELNHWSCIWSMLYLFDSTRFRESDSKWTRVEPNALKWCFHNGKRPIFSMRNICLICSYTFTALERKKNPIFSISVSPDSSRLQDSIRIPSIVYALQVVFKSTVDEGRTRTLCRNFQKLHQNGFG